MLYYHTMSFSEVDSVHVQALTRQRWMAEAPTWTTDRRASSPGSPSSESFCRLLDVGIGPLNEPGERQLMPKRPLDSTSTDGSPRVAIAFLSNQNFCRNLIRNWYGPRSRVRLRFIRARLCWCCRARRVRCCSKMARTVCACSSSVRWCDVSCTVCSERAMPPVCCS